MSNMIHRDKYRLDCSIVIPVYYNEGSLESTLASLRTVVIEATPERCFEVVFVDDGSGDGSLDKLLELRRKYPQLVRVVQLTRNFGQVNAVLAGLALSRGKCAIVISADGQDPVELMLPMLKSHFQQGYEIAICHREAREESFYRKISSKLFYGMVRRLSFPSMPRGGFDFVLLGSRARDFLLRASESHPFFQGQVLAAGYKTKFIPYRRREREHGRSRWSLARKVTYLIDAVAAYSFVPLRFMSIVGVAVACLGFLYASVVLLGKLFWGHPVEGWTPLMIVVLVLGGTQMLMLGVMGEYVWRILANTRRRQPYVVEAVHGGPDENLERLEQLNPREQVTIADRVGSSAEPEGVLLAEIRQFGEELVLRPMERRPEAD